MHREAAAQVAKLVTRHVARGASFSAMREAMWSTFRHDVMAILARYEGVLSRESSVEEIASPRSKAPNIPRGLSPHERILALLDKAGGRGATKSDIFNGFPTPRPNAETAMAWLRELEECQLIRGERMNLSNRGRPSIRFFHFNYESPRTVGGVAVFD